MLLTRLEVSIVTIKYVLVVSTCFFCVEKNVGGQRYGKNNVSFTDISLFFYLLKAKLEVIVIVNTLTLVMLLMQLTFSCVRQCWLV